MACPTEVLEELLLVGEAWRRALFDATTSVLHRSDYRLLTSRGDPLIEERPVGGVVVWHRGVSVADCAGEAARSPGSKAVSRSRSCSVVCRVFVWPVRTHQQPGAARTAIPARDDPQIRTTERSTSPRCIRVNASSTSSSAIVSLTNPFRSSFPFKWRSTSEGKSRVGRQSPYHDDLSAPPRPKSSIMGSSIVVVGSGTPTWTSTPAWSRA